MKTREMNGKESKYICFFSRKPKGICGNSRYRGKWWTSWNVWHPRWNFDGQEWSFDRKHRNMSTNVKQGASVKAQTQWISTLYCWHTRSCCSSLGYLRNKWVNVQLHDWITWKKWAIKKKLTTSFPADLIQSQIRGNGISVRDSPKMYDKIISFWI